MPIMSLAELLAREEDGKLLEIYNEISSGHVADKSATMQYLRSVNNMIENGMLRARDDNYRKMYLPTFTRALYKELAGRYASMISKEDNND